MKLLTIARDRLECRRVARRLQAYIDGALSPDQAAHIAAHLQACRRCGLDEQAYHALIASVAALAAPPDPDALDRLRRFAEGLGDAGDAGG